MIMYFKCQIEPYCETQSDTAENNRKFMAFSNCVANTIKKILQQTAKINSNKL